MLTRLKVHGFKNLVDTEIRFGPLTCVAGLNGVGKSNVFDAIRFLSLLADRPFIEAATETRGGDDITALFTVGGDGRMILECDVLIPYRGHDDFNQPAEASHTFLTYRLALRLVRDDADLPRVRLEHERLVYIPKGKTKEKLGFPFSSIWRDSTVFNSDRRAPFIDTVRHGDDTIVRLSSDKMRDQAKSKRGGGKPADFLARNLPRTVLSSAQNADEARTAVLARLEMRSWRILQLEPSALRRPDDLQSPTRLAADGSHLPATLYRLARRGDAAATYAEVANRLALLVSEVRSVWVDRDEARRVLCFVMQDRAGVELPASSLSDGTLRFVALTVLEQDPTATGVLCLEEPENGIHPGRIDAMMQLLSDMAVDVSEAADDDNPLRQVIISTHSPVVAARAKSQELVFAETRDVPAASNRGLLRSLVLRPIAKTWRCNGDAPVALGEVMSFLDSVRTNGSPPKKMKTRQLQSSEATTYEAVVDQLSFEFVGARKP